MIHKLGLFTAAAVLAFAVSARPALAQEPVPEQPPPQEQAPQEAAPIEGELLRVDVDAKVLAVRTSDGAEVEFQYSDETEVSGAEQGIAGLATMTDAVVTVHFTEDAGIKTATRIIVQPR